MTTKESSIREKTIRQIVFDLKQFKGDLELTLSTHQDLLSLSVIGIINDRVYQYSPKRFGSKEFKTNEFPELLEEFLEAGKREGYFPSLINRFLMSLGYTPNRIRLRKKQKIFGSYESDMALLAPGRGIVE
ncbi:MAG: hypothetical protein AABX50_00200 [Nanoarchaeota archaeon]